MLMFIVKTPIFWLLNYSLCIAVQVYKNLTCTSPPAPLLSILSLTLPLSAALELPPSLSLIAGTSVCQLYHY